MKINEVIVEDQRPSVKQQIIDAIRQDGGNIDEYFVRFTDIPNLGFSGRQWFGKTPDVDHPDFSVDYIGHSKGRRALWFYPLATYLKSGHVYASEQPHVWLVKLRADAWLQTVRDGDKKIMPAPPGKQRVGILRMSVPPAAIFFTKGYDVIGKYYDYAQRHQRHGQVKGPPEPSFFDRIRGIKK